MYGIFTCIWLIFMVHVGKYTIHGWYGLGNMSSLNSCFMVPSGWDKFFVAWCVGNMSSLKLPIQIPFFGEGKTYENVWTKQKDMTLTRLSSQTWSLLELNTLDLVPWYRSFIWFITITNHHDLGNVKRYPSRKFTYPTWGSSENHHLQICRKSGGYVNSLEGDRTLLKRYGCFLKWWYPQNTSKWSFLVGKPHGFVRETHHFRKPPYQSP